MLAFSAGFWLRLGFGLIQVCFGFGFGLILLGFGLNFGLDFGLDFGWIWLDFGLISA